MDKIFSGNNSEQLWQEINSLSATSTIDDVRDVFYSLGCHIQKLETKVDVLVKAWGNVNEANDKNFESLQNLNAELKSANAKNIHYKTMLVGASFIIEKLMMRLQGEEVGVGMLQQVNEFRKDMEPITKEYAEKQERAFKEIEENE